MSKHNYKENIELYASLKFPKDYKGKKDIHITTLKEHLDRYNAISDVDGNKLKIFLNEDEARKYHEEINK